MINIVAYRSNQDGYNSDLIITDYETYNEAIEDTAKSYDEAYEYHILPSSIFFVSDLHKRVHELAEIKREQERAEQEAQMAREIIRVKLKNSEKNEYDLFLKLKNKYEKPRHPFDCNKLLQDNE